MAVEVDGEVHRAAAEFEEAKVGLNEGWMARPRGGAWRLMGNWRWETLCKLE
jgi:hypothetical protein